MSRMRRPTRTDATSRPVSTARTPGTALAADVSRETMRAWGSELRSTFVHRAPGSVTSAA